MRTVLATTWLCLALPALVSQPLVAAEAADSSQVPGGRSAIPEKIAPPLQSKDSALRWKNTDRFVPAIDLKATNPRSLQSPESRSRR
jgi:hypothetical protein